MGEKEGLMDIIKRNKRILRAEYQRGFADGGKDMNEKWLVSYKELIGEFRDKLIEYKKVLKDKWESGLMSGYVRIDMFLEFMEKEIKKLREKYLSDIEK